MNYFTNFALLIPNKQLRIIGILSIAFVLCCVTHNGFGQSFGDEYASVYTEEVMDYSYQNTDKTVPLALVNLRSEVGYISPEICDDGIDNDDDGFIDCADIDCGFVENREFDNGTDFWYNYNYDTNTSTFTIDQSSVLSGVNSAYIDITNTSGTDWHVQLAQAGFSVEDGKTYEILFDARATANRPIMVSTQLDKAPWTLVSSQSFNITTSSESYSYFFTSGSTFTDEVTLIFNLGESLENVWIDNVQLKEVCLVCEADAGPDQSQCQNAIFDVQANTPLGATGQWSVVSGSATSYNGWHNPINTFTIPTGVTTLEWTVTDGDTCTVFDEITLSNTSDCSIECIDPLNYSGDIEDNGNATNFNLDFLGSPALLIDGDNNPAGWAQRYGPSIPDTVNFNAAFYIQTSSAHSGNHMIYLKGTDYCLSPLTINSNITCGKTYKFALWASAFTHSGTQSDAPLAIEASLGNNDDNPPNIFLKKEVMLPASNLFSDLNWNHYEFEVTVPDNGYEYVDFLLTSMSNDHGIFIDDVCVTEISSGSDALAGADMLNCENSFDLQANTPPTGYSGSWSAVNGSMSFTNSNSPDTDATITSGNVATARWTVTDGSCSYFDDVVLSYSSVPGLEVTDGEVCQGGTTDISVIGCTGDVLWSTGETTATISVSPTSNTSYTVTCDGDQSSNLLDNGDFESATDFEFWENWYNASITTESADVYSGNKAALIYASTGYSGAGQLKAANPGEMFTLTFWAKTTNSNALPNVGIKFFDQDGIILSQDNFVFIKNNDYTQYTVSSVAPNNSVSIQVAINVNKVSRLFLDEVILIKSTCMRSATSNVVVLDPEELGISNDGPLTCNGSDVTITLSNGSKPIPPSFSFLWESGNTGQSESVSSGGTYVVTITDSNGCTSTASTVVSENTDAPVASVSVNGIITCEDLSSTLTASPTGLTYLWSDGQTSRTINVTEGGYYDVTVTGTNGCSSIARGQVIQDNIPPTVILDNLELCEGDSGVLSPVVCENYPVIESQRPLALNSWKNIYGNQRSALIGDGELCFTVDSLNLDSPQMIGLNADPNTSNGFTNIDYAMYVYVREKSNLWRIQIRESGTSKGWAYLGTTSYVGSQFCLRRTGTTIDYLMDGEIIYTSLIESNDDLFYDHSFFSGTGIWTGGYSKFRDIALCGELALTYDWSTGESTQSIDINAADTYTLTVTDAKGCSTSAQSEVMIIDNPVVTISANGTIDCINSSSTLTALPAGLSYLWDDGNTGQSREVFSEGTYHVTVTNSDGCEGIGSMVIAPNGNPTVDITGDTELCDGEETTLSPTSGGSWSSSDEDVAIVSNTGNVSSTGPGTVTFTFTDASSGCSSTTEAVTINPDLSVSINNNGSACLESGSQLTAVPTGGSPTYTYNWIFPDNSTSTEETVDISLNGNYQLTVTDNAGCTAETSGFIYAAFEPFIFSLETSICEGENVDLEINGSNIISYAWDSNAGNANTSSVTVFPSSPSTTYIVTVTNSNGCTSTASATIGAEPLPIANAGEDVTVCENEIVTFSTINEGAGVSYVWDFGVDAVPSSANGVGPHEIIYSNPNGNGGDRANTVTLTVSKDDCTNTDVSAITIQGAPSPTVTFSPPSCGAADGSITFNFVDNPNRTSILFSIDGGILFPYTIDDNTGTFTVNNLASGDYDLMAKWPDDSCEVAISTVSLLDSNNPTISNSGNDIICLGSTTILNASTSGTWTSDNDGVATVSATGVVTGISAGIATISFVADNNCPASTTLEITVTNKEGVVITGDNKLCEGNTTSLSASAGGGTWSSNNTSIATINASGLVTAVTSGTVLISYEHPSNSCKEDASFAVEVFDTPTVSVTGTLEICVGETTTLSTTASGGYWTSSNNVAIVSSAGVVSGISAGTVSFYHTSADNCPSANTGTITVTPSVSVSIDFNGSECLKEDSQLTAVVTGGTPGYAYTWSGPGGFTGNTETIDVLIDGNYNVTVSDSKGCTYATSAFVYESYEPFIFALNTSVCEGESITLSVSGGSASAYQWSPSAGSASTQSVTVTPSVPSSSYTVTVTNSIGCTTEATAEIVVDEKTTVSITGSTDLCVGGTSQLSPNTGGEWTSSNNSVATVSNSGVVSAVGNGSATFTFKSNTTGCISDPTGSINVGDNGVITITGDNQICFSDTPTLNASVQGGTWSSTNTSVATIDANGVVTPQGQGSTNILYDVSSGDCYEDGTYTIIINNDPIISLNGPSTICEDDNTYVNSSISGTWSTSDSSIATISPSGEITGVSGGQATILFVSNSGCTGELATPITIVTSPTIELLGPADICIDNTTSLSPTSGGIWISNDDNIASVNSSGIVTGKTEGIASFTFVELSNGCTSDSTISISVFGTPAINGIDDTNLCVGETTSITPSNGGTWTSTNESVATVNDNGTITAIGPGAARFIFTNNSTGCESELSSPLSVNAPPIVSYTGPTEICEGEESSISPTTGGQWSSTDVSVATISADGVISGVGPGSVSFIYTNDATGCSSNQSSPFTVNEPTEIVLTGPSSICIGETTNIYPSTGGTWSSSNDNIATITNEGVITGYNPGVVSFTFDSNTSCTSEPSIGITVVPNPVTVFSGPSEICIGSTTNLLPNVGGEWTSSDTSVATVDNSGLVTGVGFGLAQFTFVDSNSGCESTTDGSLSVYNAPVTEVIGADMICIGFTTNLLPNTGGVWTSSNANVAVISSNGQVTGVSPGTVTFTFYETGSNCVSEASAPITILANTPVSIAGDNTICTGETTTLSPNTGGVWISNNESVATVTEDGVVTGISQGLVKFTFVTEEGCESNETSPVIVYGAPAVSINGSNQVCAGDQVQMLPSSGGTWTSGNTSLATITDDGVVTTLSSGTVNFTFIDVNTGCVSDPSEDLTINQIPNTGLNGPAEICIGSITYLTPSTGGVWTSLDPTIASIQNNGQVTGITSGNARFIFTQLSSGCISEENSEITVVNGPSINFAGPTAICEGETTSITSSSPGTWVSTNPSVATITDDGLISAVSAGTTQFRLTDSSSGCVSDLSEGLVVNGPSTVFVSGSSLVCIGSTTTLSPSTGGIWTSLNQDIATTTDDGVVTGVSEGTAYFIFTDDLTGCVSDGSLNISVASSVDAQVTGDTEICIGYTTTLSPSSGGTWTSNNPAIATVSNSGIVKGKASGIVTFTFVDSSNGCSAGGTTEAITVENCINHDFNVALVAQTITGDASTNDNISNSATYSNFTQTLEKPVGSLPQLIIASDGTYSFLTNKPGKYVYKVPVCLPPMLSGCPSTILEINVLGNVYGQNNPVSNLEFTTTYSNADVSLPGNTVEIEALSNDDCVYISGCDLSESTLAIVDAPGNGTATVTGSSTISYTPNAGFIGQDTIHYEVCETGGSCSTSSQVINVNAPNALNSIVAADDFAYTLKTTTVTGNLMTNDSDSENDAIAAIQQGSLMTPITIPEGSYFINTDGSYEFTPEDSFSGALEIIYTICDDNVDIACTDATLHIQVFDDLSLQLRVYLEGSLIQNNDEISEDGRPLMRDGLRKSPFTGLNHIPLNDPYTYKAELFDDSQDKFLKMGPGLLDENLHIIDSIGVFSVTGDNAIVDWVHVELRDKDDNTAPIATRSGLVQRDGDVVDLDGVSPLRFQGISVDSFYVCIRHRTHLGVMSSKVSSSSELIDFTSPNTPTFNFGTTLNNGFDYADLSQKATVKNGYLALWAGDFNSDGKLKFTEPASDINILYGNVLFTSPQFLINYDFTFGYYRGDYNMDGKAKFANPNDDRNYLQGQVIFHPLNVNYVSNLDGMIQQIPK